MQARRFLFPLFTVLLAAGCATILLQHCDSEVDPAKPHSDELEPKNAVNTIPRTDISLPGLDVERKRVESIDITVLDDESGKVVPMANAILPVGPEVRSLSNGDSVIGQADGSGTITLGMSHLGATLAITGEGYAAQALTIDQTGRHTVRLRRGHEFTVSIRGSDGRPLAGCIAILSSSPVSQVVADSKDAYGNPLCDAPSWIAISKSDGRAVFRGVPAGSPHLYVGGNALCPTKLLDRVSVPGELSTIYMQELYGIVVRSTNDSPFIWHRFSMDTSQVLPSGCESAQGVLVSASLSKRFPGSLVFATLLKNPLQITPIHLRVMQGDGSAGELSWALQPVSTIRDPVFLEPNPSKGTGKIQVTIRHGEEEILGVPLSVVGLTQFGSYRGVSGEPLSIPVGTYRVKHRGSLPWLREFFQDLRVELSNGDEKTLVVTIPWPLYRVQVVPEFQHEGNATPIHVGVLHIPTQKSSLRSNWRLSSGPIKYWLPPGEVKIRATASGYRETTATINIAAENKGEEKIVTLILKKE